ncbi:hypothetical protein BDZ91DRAFT_797621 [Kalaharituber pfeilii]|nr:hypothetical protein BDZ91DRAFT_797621 [Kalaharituber pfeilii]
MPETPAAITRRSQREQANKAQEDALILPFSPNANVVPSGVVPQDNQPSTAQASLPVQSEAPPAPPQDLPIDEPWVIYNQGALMTSISPASNL